MKLRLEQLIYGSGPQGYAVLGSSPGAAPFAARAERLCGGVGTPPGDWNGAPFLLSLPVGEHVLMACGRRGEPDSMGRGTLFFHVLAASRKDLDGARADAFSLFSKGAFEKRMPGGPVETATFEVKPVGDGSGPAGPGNGDSFPAFLRSNDPAPEVVRALLGDRANERAWATFAFRAMDGFDLQVLPFHVPEPMGARECDASGRPLPNGEKPRNPTPSKGGERSTAAGQSVSSRHSPQPQPQSSAMVKLSLAANVFLALLCAFLFVFRKQEGRQPVPSPETPVPAATVEDLAQAKTEAARLEAVNAELSRKIEAQNRQLAEAAKRSEADAAEAVDRMLDSLPEYFTEEQCAHRIYDWESKTRDGDFAQILNQWLQFFNNHPRTVQHQKGTKP